jgi:hypothetical protein
VKIECGRFRFGFGICLLHCKTDVEQISDATTISKLREETKTQSSTRQAR